MIVPDRDLTDSSDIFHCLRADDGSEVWKVRYLARGNLDYGNSSRSTPIIQGDRVFLFGAMGNLHCVELETGKIVWKKDIARQFKLAGELPWGYCASPLLVDGKVIVSPGAADAAIVAVKADTGELAWKAPGDIPGYGSLVAGTLGGKLQIVGHDKTSLGGWEVATGERLWRLDPPNQHDFNVPTPVICGDRLLVATENNGTRSYAFSLDGRIISEPAAHNTDLVPDSHSPVVIDNRVFGISSGLHCLNAQSLKEIWKDEDQAYQEYASIIGSDDRLLVTSQRGELMLVDAKADAYRLLARLKLFTDEPGIYSHPAIAGKRLYIRSSGAVHCLELE